MAEKEEDRISKLPDDILSQILSFLELGEAVKTSILSKRWEKVWTLIHRISLDNESYIRRPNFGSPLSYEEQMKRGISFINLLTRVLCGKRILSVTSFHLTYNFGFQDEDDESSLITKWIDAAVSSNLENFDIILYNVKSRFDPVSLIKMPRALLECHKLVTLNLSYSDTNFICLQVPKTVCLPSLEMLHLACVKFKDENTLKNFLLGCPVLEQLYLRKIYDGHDRDQQNVFVFSPSLKILTVDHPEDPENDGAFNPFCSNYVVEAPKLENLDFVDECLSGFTMTPSPCLVSAVIHISTCEPLPVTRVFQGISNVQNLELRTCQTIMLEDELANLPELHNLIHLKIRWCVNVDIIPCILQRSPHLKHLIFSEDVFWWPFMYSLSKWVPECLTLQLEIIEIKHFSTRHEEEILKLVEYLLDNGKVLKKIVVTSFSNDKFSDKVKELFRADTRLCCFKK